MPITEALDLLKYDDHISDYFKIESLDKLISEVPKRPCIMGLPLYKRTRYEFPLVVAASRK